MAKRIFLLDVLVLLLPCFLIIDAVTGSSPKLSKPNCTDLCGNITIPYPFGMDRSECFLDPWYEIVCRNGTIPFLKKIDLQVLNISLPAYRRIFYNGLTGGYNGVFDSPYVTVNSPIIYSDSSVCSTEVTGLPPSLNGSPFTISSYMNAFTAVGCNVSAMMNSSHDSFVGCNLQCRGGDYFPSRCKTTVIPNDLQTFSVAFISNPRDETGMINDRQCNYALLANESWLQHEFTDVDPLKTKGYAPVVLEWGISNKSELAIELDIRKAAYVFSYSTSSNMTILAYSCDYGYVGNAYLKDGCQDINECEDPTNRCPKRCVNTPGWYDCVDPNKTLKLTMIGIGSGVGALLLVFLGWRLYQFIKKRKEKKLKEKYFKRNGGLLLQQQLLSPEGNLQKGKLFTQKDLEKATENFSESRVLGKGGQGTVYKGMLTDGRIVAIKKALVIDEGNIEQFINEVMILSQISHRNIVKLLGCCLETEIPLLVYEFIPNGNLYEYLHESNNEYQISWEVRLQLAAEIAGALFYLHSAASLPIYHRDIKSTNILLDEKYCAKVADFGTSRSVSLDQTHVTTLVQGTIGYLDPEFFQTYQFTDKSDVYSFGVVLVELLTGQKPISTIRMEEGRNLATHFVLSMEDGHLFDILDTQVLNQGAEEEILIVANLARRCLHLSGRCRPTMKEVTVELEGIRKLLHLSNVKESEEGHNQVQCQNICRSISARLKVDANVTALSDAQPLLHG